MKTVHRRKESEEGQEEGQFVFEEGLGMGWDSVRARVHASSFLLCLPSVLCQEACVLALPFWFMAWYSAAHA